MSETALVEVRVNTRPDESEDDLARKVRACLNGNRSNAYFRDIEVLTIEEPDTYE